MVTVIRLAPLTTWLLVSTKPSGVNTNPDPLPTDSLGARGRRPGRCWPFSPPPWTSMRTTDGLTAAATAVTVRE